MTKVELEKLCEPQKPKETLEELRLLYDLHANDMGKPVDRELQALYVAIELLKIEISGSRG